MPWADVTHSCSMFVCRPQGSYPSPGPAVGEGERERGGTVGCSHFSGTAAASFNPTAGFPQKESRTQPLNGVTAKEEIPLLVTR